jgi:hypothetical protein
VKATIDILGAAHLHICRASGTWERDHDQDGGCQDLHWGAG